MSLLVIYNPVCGDGTAKSFFEQEVLPLLERHGKNVEKIVATESAGHAGTILVDFLESVEGEINVVLGSGDGTLHEIINVVSSAELKGVRAVAPPSRLHFVLVPCGTANALYSSLFLPTSHEKHTAYRLRSVQSFIDGSGTVPLTLAITTLLAPPSERKRPRVAISSVVVSAALHASILHDSESLRKEMPGIERFKVAAQNNSTKWYNSFVKLLPSPSARVVQVYDPSTQDFVDHPESDEYDPIVDLDGPFAYFLSTVNVDRLEPAFRITPLASKIPPAEPAFDVVIVRPMRDPSISWDTPEARVNFVAKMWTVLGSAYTNGTHINLRYAANGEIVSDGGGPTVVEYMRCGGWEWIPVN